MVNRVIWEQKKQIRKKHLQQRCIHTDWQASPWCGGGTSCGARAPQKRKEGVE
jgi:hypothetical protein